MNAVGAGLIALGLLLVGMGLLDRRWGNPGWRRRLLTGLIVALGGVYALLRG